MSIWIKLDTIEIVIGYCHQHCINGSSVQPTPWPPEVLHFDPAKPLGTCTGGGRARIDWSSVIWPPSDSFDTQSFVNPSPTCCAIHHHDLGWTPKVSLHQKFPKSASRRWTMWCLWSIPWMWLAPKLVCQPWITKSLNCFSTISFSSEVFRGWSCWSMFDGRSMQPIVFFHSFQQFVISMDF